MRDLPTRVYSAPTDLPGVSSPGNGGILPIAELEKQNILSALAQECGPRYAPENRRWHSCIIRSPNAPFGWRSRLTSRLPTRSSVGRGLGWPKDIPLLRGISTFVFNDHGLIQHYEDFFDPDWRTRHGAGK